MISNLNERHPIDTGKVNKHFEDIKSKILKLEKENQSTKHIDNMKGSVFSLSSNSKVKLINLVGKECLVNCVLDQVQLTVLWDTGAQVSLIPYKLLSALKTDISYVNWRYRLSKSAFSCYTA
ncbi:hypothetical protein DPMN_070476 [Dreissena polymorpha]|uniref:Uncharacterized protein n=1 Tax=Dreissena polymorpha TaxID=45954 RepID=A0A9D3Z0U5_DREPO|nr:hypothetical protein DPMN_070476 [Dreissena polymorpha]